jgi:hypothetical protein
LLVVGYWLLVVGVSPALVIQEWPAGSAAAPAASNRAGDIGGGFYCGLALAGAQTSGTRRLVGSQELGRIGAQVKGGAQVQPVDGQNMPPILAVQRQSLEEEGQKEEAEENLLRLAPGGLRPACVLAVFLLPAYQEGKAGFLLLPW